jgi:hypothetical protein
LKMLFPAIRARVEQKGTIALDSGSGAVVWAHLCPLQWGQARARIASSVAPPLLRGVG